jgi:hypothetical protein
MNPPYEFRRPFAMPADFRRLGLRRGECSSIAIRDATHNAVHRLADASSQQSRELVDRQLGQLATSAYRLLDPRYRTQLYERVQLSYLVDRDEAKPVPSQNALLTVPDAPIALDSPQGSIELNEALLEENDSLDSAREVVRWIRHSEEKHRALRSIWPSKLLVSLKAWLLNRTS